MKRLYMIGNTHFDPVWLWRWDEAMASIRATFRSALDRMKEDPDFIYSFATPPVFEWIRRVDPDMFEEIRARVSEGRWELGEAWWVQPDCYAALGESYVRQGLYGQRYLKKTFNKYAECVFNIDSFGHSPMLPQILSKSGVTSYCFVRPGRGDFDLQNPLFRWRSPDGSEVLSYRAHHAYRDNVKKNFEEWDGKEDALIVYGVTDHGGAPTKEALAAIREASFAHCSSLHSFFENHSTDYTVTDELLTGDFGPYSNYSRIKYRNRLAERAVLNAERSDIIAVRRSAERLSECWKDILFNQFHDILGGASIKDAYLDAEDQLGRAISTANEIIHFNLQSVTRKITMLGKNPESPWNIVAWNLNGKPYNEYMEAEVQWAHEFGWYDKGLCLEDEVGNKYPCQIIREKSVIPRFRSRFIFTAPVPSMGYKVFKLIQTNETITKPQIDPYNLQTDRLSVRFSENGILEEITDRSTNKKIKGPIMQPVCYDDLGDTWCFNIKRYETVPHYFSFEGFKVTEAGELMTELKGTYRIGDSKLEVYYRFYRDRSYFDLRYRVRWSETHKVLKLESLVSSSKHKVAVPGGSFDRDIHEADVPMGGWIDCQPFSVVSDSIFAYSMENDLLGLTLLRSPIYGDLRIAELDESIDYDFIDVGIVEGSLRLCLDATPWDMIEAFGNPPIIIDEANHIGSLPTEYSYFGIEDNDTALMAYKYCEDDQDRIIRLNEMQGKSHTASIYVEGKEYKIPLSPYEIKTVKIQNGTWQDVTMLEN